MICPLAWTEASLRVYKASPDEFKPLIEANPMKRWGDAEKDIGRVAVFLASEDSDFMTGQTLLVEGGSNMT